MFHRHGPLKSSHRSQSKPQPPGLCDHAGEVTHKPGSRTSLTGRQGPEARQLRSTALPAGCALGPQSGSQPPSSVRPRGGHHRDPVCGEQGTNKTGRPSSTPTQNSSLLVGTAQSEAKFSGHSEAPVTGLQAKAGQPPEGRAGSGTPATPSETSVSRGPQSPQPDLTAPASPSRLPSSLSGLLGSLGQARGAAHSTSAASLLPRPRGLPTNQSTDNQPGTRPATPHAPSSLFLLSTQHTPSPGLSSAIIPARILTP